MKEKSKELLHVLQLFDSLIEERGGSKIKFLLYVASKYPHSVTLTNSEKKLGLTQGQVSRIARSFSTVNAEKKTGLDLVDINFDPYDPMTKLITLNEKGVRVLKAFLGR